MIEPRYLVALFLNRAQMTMPPPFNGILFSLILLTNLAFS